MSLFEKIFPKPRAVRDANAYFKTLTAYRPVFQSWNGCLYESELVRSAIDAIARNCSKLKVEINGAAKPVLQTQLRKRPNEWMTWNQYLYRLATILYADNTAFIVPVYDKYGDIVGTYPVLPDRCAVIEHKGQPWLKYTFRTGETSALPMSECGIMTRFQYDQDFFGSTNGALRPTMELISIQNQGIKEGVKNSATFRFMAQLNNFADDEDVKKERQRFNRENLQDSDGGLLLFSNRFSNIQQIDSKPFVVNAVQMQQIQTNVYNYFGVNEAVMQGKAYGDDFSAFYESTIEVFAIQFSEVLTKMLFTEREIGFGSEIIATSNRLQFMTNTDKLAFTTNMLDRGIITLNQALEVWNLPSIGPEGDVRIIRGEYYNADEKMTEEQPND